jgi:hypothetical protein
VDNQQRALEFLKLYYDYFKHQTTISATAAVVLVALFRGETPWISLFLLGVSAVLAFRGMLTLTGRLAASVAGNVTDTKREGLGLLLVRLTHVSWGLWVAAIVWAVGAVALGQ